MHATMIDTLIKNIEQYCKQHRLLPSPGTTILVGLSGGPDSVFLVHTLMQLCTSRDIRLVAAHLDHEWRPESGTEREFCRALATNLALPFEGMKASELPMQPTYNGSQEAFGRTLRRQFFALVQQKHTAHAIALAHHEQDQQETFFIRLLRGSSLTGLTGMRPRDGAYIRPLLATNKQAILAYLSAHNIAYMSDPSNNSLQYLRNRIRHTVLPVLKGADTRFNLTFNKTLHQLQETEKFLENMTATTLADLREQESTGTIIINVKKFCALHSVMQKRVLIQWLCAAQVSFAPSNTFLMEIISFLHLPHGGSHKLHAQWCIQKKSGRASIHYL